MDHWIAQSFRQPESLTLGGKPVAILFSPERLREDMSLTVPTAP